MLSFREFEKSAKEINLHDLQREGVRAHTLSNFFLVREMEDGVYVAELPGREMWSKSFSHVVAWLYLMGHVMGRGIFSEDEAVEVERAFTELTGLPVEGGVVEEVLAGRRKVRGLSRGDAVEWLREWEVIGVA